MRDKKMFLSVILIATVMLFAGCGNLTVPVSAEPTETVKEVDTQESVEPTSAPAVEPEESVEPTPFPVATPEESMESSEVEGNSENEVDTTEVIISMDDTVMYATAKCNIRSGAGTQYDKVGSLSYAQEVTINGKVEAGEDKLWYVIKTEDGSTRMVSASMLSETKPAAQTSSVNGSGSSSNSGGSTEGTGNSETAPAETPAPAQTAPASTPAPVQTPAPTPVHEHSWKEHTATTQVWVPNIVVVDDYETRYVVVGGKAICNCGFETTDKDVIAQHCVNHARAGEQTNFTVQDVYGEETVKVGSHEEDHGHYESSTYVDYQYCECGATK